MQHNEKPAVERSLALYLALLRAYPPAVRERYGAEMALAFRDEARDAWSRAGFFGLIALWVRTVGDTIVNATRERLNACRADLCWRRVVALLADRGITLGLYLVLLLFVYPVLGVMGFDLMHIIFRLVWQVPPATIVVLAFACCFLFGLPCLDYGLLIPAWVVFVIARDGKTPGMNACGLSISTVDSSPVRRPQILLWHFASYISLLACGLGYLWVLIDPDGRTWHDIVAGVRVSLTSEVTDQRGALG